jgi:DNA modification methylase
MKRTRCSHAHFRSQENTRKVAPHVTQPSQPDRCLRGSSKASNARASLSNIIWSGSSNRWCSVAATNHYRHEPILYGWLEDGSHYFCADRTQDTVFEVDRPAISVFHPTTKPVELIARMIANSSRAGELVYDPFCGSGSTLLAAHQLNRVGYGVEIDLAYVAVTLERLSVLGLKPELVR